MSAFEIKNKKHTNRWGYAKRLDVHPKATVVNCCSEMFPPPHTHCRLEDDDNTALEYAVSKSSTLCVDAKAVGQFEPNFPGQGTKRLPVLITRIEAREKPLTKLLALSVLQITIERLSRNCDMNIGTLMRSTPHRE